MTDLTFCQREYATCKQINYTRISQRPADYEYGGNC